MPSPRKRRPAPPPPPPPSASSTSPVPTFEAHPPSQQQPQGRQRRVLFVIAHPDDETMFFSPTMAHYRRHGSAMSMLCVSTGDYYGQGAVRRRELEEACRLLGIPADRLTLLDDKDLRDGPDNTWPVPLLCYLIREAVTREGIDEVVTFDEGGVSGHPNHVALARAVSSLVRPTGEEIPMPPAVKVWALETTNIIRKFVGSLDILVSVLVCLWLWLCESVRQRTRATDYKGNRSSSTNGFRLCLNGSPSLTYRAMLAHASQFVWYRRLFIVFSRYTYVNTLRELRGRQTHIGGLGSNQDTAKAEERRNKR